MEGLGGLEGVLVGVLGGALKCVFTRVSGC